MSATTSSNPPGFSGWLKKNIWPIEKFELKKFLPMFFMFFCISFNYTVLRNMKDALIVNAPGSGAEAIPFIKLFLVTPAALLYMMLYIKLSSTLSKQKVFYIIIAPFLIFLGLFAFVLYPNVDIIHPTQLAESLRLVSPKGLHGIISIFQNWSYALFYVTAELWGTVALSVLFWGFANDITKVNESKRFYALFSLGANLALLFVGPVINYVTELRKNLPAGVDGWGQTLQILSAILLVSGVVIIALYYHMNKNILTDKRFYDPSQVKKKKKKKKMGVWESIKYLSTSKYIGYIAILVLAYGVSINLVEVTWKDNLKALYPDSNDYLAFMGKFSSFTGLATVIMILFVSSNVIRRFGWGTGAMITPVMLMATSIIFFLAIIFKDSLDGVFMAVGSSPLMFIAMLGAIQNILSKSSKYSLFDPTKEMAYIPLDDDLKTNGKAAVDGIGGRLGKSGGAAVNGVLISVLGTVGAITPYVFAVTVFIILAWMIAVKKLNIEFIKLTTQQNNEEADLKESEGQKKGKPAIAG